MELSDFKYTLDESILDLRSEDDTEYDLYTPQGRRLYFNSRVAEEITFLREYLSQNTFIGYMLGPKMAGKGTYTNQLKEILGEGYFENISVGDLVRDAEKEYLEQGEKNSELYKYTEKNYRGFLSLEEVFQSLTNRSTAKLSLPTEFVLMLVKRQIEKFGKKSIFIDGFPRNIDQVSFSLVMRDLVNFREDPDCFIFINLPIAVINARIKDRRTCPVCRNSRNIELNPTSIVKTDPETGDILLYCDNPGCVKDNIKMERKEGDEKGIDLIKDRVITDLQVMEMARKMYGIYKFELYNAVPFDSADKLTYSFERTYSFKHEIHGSEVISTKTEYIVEDHGKKYYSMLPPYVVVRFIKELAKMFGFQKS